MSLLETVGLRKDFGGVVAINALDFHVDEGEIVSVIGPNGAGKTTFFNLITGMQPPDSGEIQFEGESIVGLTPDVLVRRGIARTFQNVRLFANMTVLENVMVAQHCRLRFTLERTSMLRWRMVPLPGAPDDPSVLKRLSRSKNNRACSKG